VRALLSFIAVYALLWLNMLPLSSTTRDDLLPVVRSLQLTFG
jgi:hypothetical protein